VSRIAYGGWEILQMSIRYLTLEDFSYVNFMLSFGNYKLFSNFCELF
jgi:hypothetical protein